MSVPEPPRIVRLTVDYQAVEIEASPDQMLIDFLNRKLNLTQTGTSCRHGTCGVCCVRVDRKLTFSCVTPVRDVEGHEVVTCEAPGMTGSQILFGAWD